MFSGKSTADGQAAPLAVGDPSAAAAAAAKVEAEAEHPAEAQRRKEQERRDADRKRRRVMEEAAVTARETKHLKEAEKEQEVLARFAYLSALAPPR